MSRHPIANSESNNLFVETEEFVNLIAHHSTPKAITLEEIRQETAKDLSLQSSIQAYRDGQWFKLKESYPAYMGCSREHHSDRLRNNMAQATYRHPLHSATVCSQSCPLWSPGNIKQEVATP